MDRAVVPEVVVVDLLEGAVEDAERAFVQDIEAQDVRRAGARDQAVGRQRHRHAAVVEHPLGHGEHVVLIDLVDPLEAQALAIVPGQRDRPGRGQHLAVGSPEGIAPGQAHVAAGPAEVGEVGVLVTARRQQHDLRAVALDRLPVLGQHQVVDAPGGERDRTAQRRVLDPDPRRFGEQLRAALRGPGGVGARDRGVRDRGAWGFGAWGFGVGDAGPRRRAQGVQTRRDRARRRFGGLLLPLLLLQLGHHEQVLIAEQDDERQRDRQD